MSDSIYSGYFTFFPSLWNCSATALSIKFVFWVHLSCLAFLFLLSTIGKKFGMREYYVVLLEKMFQFVAKRLGPQTGSGFEEDSDVTLQDKEVIISTENPSVKNIKEHSDVFAFEDLLPYVKEGVQSVLQDTYIKSLSPQQLSSWNVLTRTRKRIQNKSVSKSVTLLWISGVFFRYLILVPVRLAIMTVSMITLATLTFLVGFIPESHFKRKVNSFVVCWSFEFIACTGSLFVRFHDKENRPRSGITVANHSSLIDSVVLATDNCYDMVGQEMGCFLGVLLSALSRASSHIWFERSCGRQRGQVLKRLELHTRDASLPPLLMYPEGMCVNNASILKFRKGVFEIDTVVYPIAIKYDPRYGDAYWSDVGVLKYIFSLISSWAVVCDVWYLPPMRRNASENPQDFADRVRSAIAKKIGLTEVEWDGFFLKIIAKDKRLKEEKEKAWLQKQQREFSRRFKPHEKHHLTPKCPS